MKVPRASFKTRAVVYPITQGEYMVASIRDQKNNFEMMEKASRIEIEGNSLNFKRSDNLLPTRIVTGIQREDLGRRILPFECSLGVIHKNRPPKRFHWGLIHTHYRTIVAITSYPEIYGNPPGAEIKINILTSSGERYDNTIVFEDGNESMWLEINDLIQDKITTSQVNMAM